MAKKWFVPGRLGYEGVSRAYARHKDACNVTRRMTYHRHFIHEVLLAVPSFGDDELWPDDVPTLCPFCLRRPGWDGDAGDRRVWPRFCGCCGHDLGLESPEWLVDMDRVRKCLYRLSSLVCSMLAAGEGSVVPGDPFCGGLTHGSSVVHFHTWLNDCGLRFGDVLQAQSREGLY